MSYALITGASKGIGKAIALELAKRKHNLLLVARSKDLLKSVSTEITQQYGVKVDYLAADLSLANSALEVYHWCVSKHYQVDILINNAGYGLSGEFESHPLEDNLNMMQINMHTPIQLCQLFLPMLRKQSRAHILNISSSAAYQAVPGLSVYAATKAFVLHFSRALREELKKSSVRVSTICPGSTDTEFATRAKVGPNATKAAAKVNMTPEAVAQAAVCGMFKNKAEMIPGLINKLQVFATWLLPKAIVEGAARKLYLE